ncbi:MAG TPA: hypothetical protein VMZ53_21190 [Kofleriaceae bacterium]|nr:hypothetical protein [Kofleriaceae bacterium]
MLHAIDRADIDGFYGEPAEFDVTLEVELLVIDAAAAAEFDDDRITTPIPRLREVALAAETISVDGLEDAWFGSFDENAELPADAFDDEPTTTWQKIGDWLKNLGRAA